MDWWEFSKRITTGARIFIYIYIGKDNRAEEVAC